ncbi:MULTISPECIES: K(+)-transporting ATPase subunit F [Dickeya]|uniref:K(+)-transporting ATPase subunit F n=1 Tax=Dickeya oryzae TaxID=1240404 RepID=A0AB39IL47_9GAMM|nr:MULTISPECIES: K(+)-transporting ATPase subunit F [Dickeya]MCA6989571.1 K(+)-transporting ATPase subunit F [Dickeya oryzae]MCA6994296.1 K(+)-transporting ATPase subunit F [Dickeya oryzae]MCO7252810.1 K(+)-transporting ATPase subunit F [Dickeya oryzae]UUE11131.1 K(+)-transporting ATPase subunit F [Dickeya zeae]
MSTPLEVTVNIGLVAGGMLVVLLLVYLFYALLNAEEF